MDGDRRGGRDRDRNEKSFLRNRWESLKGWISIIVGSYILLQWGNQRLLMRSSSVIVSTSIQKVQNNNQATGGYYFWIFPSCFSVLCDGNPFAAHSELLVGSQIQTLRHSLVNHHLWNSVYMVSIVSSVKIELLAYFRAISVCVVSLTEMGGVEMDDWSLAYFWIDFLTKLYPAGWLYVNRIQSTKRKEYFSKMDRRMIVFVYAACAGLFLNVQKP